MLVRDRIIVGLCIAILAIPFYVTEYIKDTKDNIGYTKLKENVAIEECNNVFKVYITPMGECYHLKKTCAGKNAIETTLGRVTKEKRACKKCVQ